jgi:hypothetical protein
MDFSLSRSRPQWVVLVIFALLGMATAVNYYVDVILPTTGGTVAENAKYNQIFTAAELAAQQATTFMGADTLTARLRDSQNIGSKSLSLALASAQDATVMAVLGTGSDDSTLSAAQLLKNFDVRTHTALSHESRCNLSFKR